MNDHVKIIEIVIAGLVGLGSKYGIDFFNSKRREKRVDFDTILQRLDKELTESKKKQEELSAKNQELQNQLLKMQGEIMNLRNKIILLESAQNHSPLPMWLKDTDGTMLALNDAYTETFLEPNGISKKDYVGHFDKDVWPLHIAQEYGENDRQVLVTKKVFRGRETVKINDTETQWRIIKYPRYAGEIVIGIAGVAIPEDWKEGLT